MITAKVVGADKVMENLLKLADVVKADAKEKVSLAGASAHVMISDQAGYEDEHTDSWLYAMGHPYSKTYKGNVEPHGGDDTIVHIKTGLLHDNIKLVENFTNTEATVEVGVSIDDVPYIANVINGFDDSNKINSHTKHASMRPRHFIQKGFELSMDEINNIMNKG